MSAAKKIKTLPRGKSYFDDIIANGSYYVDKTLFVRDLLDSDSSVTLCTRPRRFGKTLNQTMLKAFFEDTAPLSGRDTRALFNGLKIEDAGEEYMARQGKYPVIFLSFKEAKRASFDDSYENLIDSIADEFSRHKYAKEKIADKEKQDLFEKLSSRNGTQKEYADSLRFLCECLENYHKQKAVILIDEYDVPLENAWFNGFYAEIVNFIRPLMSSALKENPYLLLSVITGCLRISKESIFTGLNNLTIISTLSWEFSEYFGFTQKEVDAILKYYGIEEKRQILREWYNGYLFGNTEVYNPWSCVHSITNWRINIDEFPKPYWVNTSSNDIVRHLIDRADNETKDELVTLMDKGTITKSIHEDITYGEIDKSMDDLWNFMFFTGYLKKVGKERMEDENIVMDLSIPNDELHYIYKRKVKEWFNEHINSKNLDVFFKAILNADMETFQAELSKLLAESISFMDSAENFYHGFMVGILSRLSGYRVKSNRESGDGRNDLVLYSANGIEDKAIIFELKSVNKFDDMPAACKEALKQIEDKNYADEWYTDGYRTITKYGIAFYRKRCRVENAEK